MIPLSGVALEVVGVGSSITDRPLLLRVRERDSGISTQNDILLARNEDDLLTSPQQVTLAFEEGSGARSLKARRAPRIILSRHLAYLQDGDVLRLDPRTRKVR